MSISAASTSTCKPVKFSVAIVAVAGNLVLRLYRRLRDQSTTTSSGAGVETRDVPVRPIARQLLADL